MIATTRTISALSAVVAIVLVGSVAGAPSCATMLANPEATIAYPFAPYMACLNNTALGLALANDMAALAKGTATLHSLGPYQRPSLDAITRAANVTRLSLFAQYLDYTRAYSLARDKHFAYFGLPAASSIEVVRPVFLGLREAAGADGGGVEVFVAGIVPEEVLDRLRALPALAGEPESIPSYAALFAAYGKAVRRINGRDAVQWARAQAALIATESASTNMNVAASASFFFALPNVLDLRSAAETYEFADGSSLTTLRWLFKPNVPASWHIRCDLSSTSDQTPQHPQQNEGGQEAVVESAAIATTAEQRGGQPALTSPSEAAMRAAMRQVGVVPPMTGPLSVPTLMQHAYEAAGLPVPAATPPASVTAPPAPPATSGPEPAPQAVNEQPGLQNATKNWVGTPLWWLDNDFAEAYVTTVGARSVAVLRIKTFAPASLEASTETSLIAAFLPFYQQLDGLMNASAGVTAELLLDVSSNTGGYLALADLALRMLDPEYNLRWQTSAGGSSSGGGSEAPPLVNPTAKNTALLRAYLRPSQLAAGSPMRNYYPNLLNDPYTYGETAAHRRDWFRPVRRAGYTGIFQRPSLFTAQRAEASPFRTVRILSDGFCGSACCNVVERITRFGLKLATTVELVGFGGDPSDRKFQMAVFCGGSVMQTSCALSQAGLTTNPFMTSSAANSDFDATFVNTVWFASPSTKRAAQFEMRAFASRVIRDWLAVGNSDASHNQRVLLATQASSPADLAGGEGHANVHVKRAEGPGFTAIESSAPSTAVVAIALSSITFAVVAAL